jgi:hypothetical protein
VSHWIPTLSLAETESGCRLSLHDKIHGEGPTLQTAADQLVARVLDVALAVRKCSTYWSPQFAARDEEWMEFLYDLGAVAAQGGDARTCVLGG